MQRSIGTKGKLQTSPRADSMATPRSALRIAYYFCMGASVLVQRNCHVSLSRRQQITDCRAQLSVLFLAGDTMLMAISRQFHELRPISVSSKVKIRSVSSRNLETDSECKQ